MRLILIVAIWTCSIISIVEGEGREGVRLNSLNSLRRV